MKQWLWDNWKNLLGIWFVTVQAKLAGIISRVMIALGVGWVAQAIAMPKVKDAIAPYFTGIPSQYQELIAAMNVDKAATMLLSALVVKYAGALVFASKASWQSPS